MESRCASLRNRDGILLTRDAVLTSSNFAGIRERYLTAQEAKLDLLLVTDDMSTSM
jgi:hypothetical protein